MEQLFIDFICASCNYHSSKTPEQQLACKTYINNGSYRNLGEDANSNMCDLHFTEKKPALRLNNRCTSADSVNDFKLKNLLIVDTASCNRYFLTRKCCYLVHCLHMKTNFGYAMLRDEKILNDDRVVEAVEKCVTEQIEVGTGGKSYSQLVKKERKNALQVLRRMKAALSSTFIRITGYVLFKVFKWMFSSVIVTEEQLEMIKVASRRNLPLIFVPLHRSHIDYLFVSWVLFNMEVGSPLVAAGDNLRLPVFGNLLRSLGGFFIKRKLESSNDHQGYVYRAILQTYMSRALISGYNLEFFIEGGRTRSGKPCMAKGGLLSVIVDAFLSGDISDVLIVPIAINYDKLIDGTFITEQLGQNKVPETFWGAVRAIVKTLKTNFGNARIDFSQPFSLKEYYQSSKMRLQSQIENIPDLAANNIVNNHCRSLSNVSTKELNGSLHQARSNSSLFGNVVTDDYRKFIKMLGSHILYDAERCQAIMASNILAWLLSFAYREGTSLSTVVADFHQLSETLQDKKRDVGFSGVPLDAVIHAIEMLGSNLVHVEGNLSKDDIASIFIRPITELPSIIELNYYANSLLPIFALDCITATALVSMIDCDMKMYKDVDTVFTVKDSELCSRTTKLCDLLSNEFILAPPCKELGSKIDQSIQQIILNGLLENKEENTVRRRYYSDDSDDEVMLETYYKLKPTSTTIKQVALLTRALAPIIEAYYATACNLVSLIDNPLPEKEFITSTQNLICSMMSKNAITYGESVAADPIRNCLKKLEDDRVIDSYSWESKKYLFLHKAFSSEQLIFPLIDEIRLYKI